MSDGEVRPFLGKGFKISSEAFVKNVAITDVSTKTINNNFICNANGVLPVTI